MAMFQQIRPLFLNRKVSLQLQLSHQCFQVLWAVQKYFQRWWDSRISKAYTNPVINYVTGNSIQNKWRCHRGNMKIRSTNKQKPGRVTAMQTCCILKCNDPSQICHIEDNHNTQTRRFFSQQAFSVRFTLLPLKNVTKWGSKSANDDT